MCAIIELFLILASAVRMQQIQNGLALGFVLFFWGVGGLGISYL